MKKLIIFGIKMAKKCTICNEKAIQKAEYKDGVNAHSSIYFDFRCNKHSITQIDLLDPNSLFKNTINING